MPTAVVPAALVAPAAAPLTAIVRSLTGDRLADPTPCTEFDVRALLHHLLSWGPVLEAAARKEVAGPADRSDLAPAELTAALETQIRMLAAAWGDPSAWTGETAMGGPTAMPASLVGGMVVGELVVHGWDLARAVGRQPEWDPTVLAYVHGEVTATAAIGRDMGVYGPEVAVPDTASTLDQLLAATGRDPNWAPEPPSP